MESALRVEKVLLVSPLAVREAELLHRADEPAADGVKQCFCICPGRAGKPPHWFLQPTPTVSVIRAARARPVAPLGSNSEN